jgi:arylsulfatase A-like enzyme
MNLVRRCCLGLVLFGAIAATVLATAVRADELATVSRRPNILFIFTDDQSYKTLRCYPGSFPWVRTPNIDSLAAAGVRFERAYLGSWCMPSRAALLTGRHPHGIESLRMEGDYPGSTYDPAQCRFWPAEFRKHGYHTAQIGKWHTGTDAGFGRDWDYQIVWNRPKHPANAGNYYEQQILAFNGEERMTEGYSTDNYTRWACEYIRGEHRDAAKPWYLWLCYGGVHGPSHPAKRHLGAYADAKVTPPADIFSPRPGKPKYLDVTQAWIRGPGGVPVMGTSGEKFGDESAKNAKTHAAWVQQVNECVLSLDEGVGQLIAALKETGQLENTIVVFSADQGFSMGEHGFRTKIAPYDANYASPLIVTQPGTLPQGKVCRQAVNAPDLVVTFFRFAGLELPWAMHGRDITPLVRDPEHTPWPHPVLYEHTGHHYGSDVTRILAERGPAVHSNVPWYVAIRHGNYKYIRTLAEGETEEVYDLDADPEELTNLAIDSKNGGLLARLRNAAIDELRRTGSQFIEHMPTTAAMRTSTSR